MFVCYQFYNIYKLQVKQSYYFLIILIITINSCVLNSDNIIMANGFIACKNSGNNVISF